MFDLAWKREPTEVPSLPEKPSLAAVLLASGHLLKVRGITLYPADKIAEIAQLRQIAAQKLGGVSTGIGFLGSPAWAIGGGLALGLLEKAMSGSAKKEGLTTLRDAEARALNLLRAGENFPVGQIENRDQPIPVLWLAKTRTGQQFAHDGGDFVTVDTSAGPMSIRWQHVASYSIVPGPNDSEAQS